MTDSIERFSSRVADYVKYRPTYPQEVVPFLTMTCDLRPDSVVADIGAGTGISSRRFLENGNKVFGVEPNAAMRSAAIEYLKDFSRFTPIGGTAEATTLRDASVDMIVAGQAFHWFDSEETKTEFRRILKPHGFVVLMWNERQLDATPFLIDYEALLKRYSTDYEVVRHDRYSEDVIREWFGHEVGMAAFANKQVLDFQGLKGRALSSSYVPGAGQAGHEELLRDLQALFAKHARNDKIEILYDTNLYYSRI
ncbi:MAG: class I SAM-dependent methyltransferase [Acidobacteria bacterium]|nr:class I SAM-dependent methyltransferase [Acidobacteriota bacterium]